VIICERDIDDPFLASGAIVFEQYTCVSPDGAYEQARRLRDGGTYGRVWIADLTNITELTKHSPAERQEVG
jgi:hypothetical protein